MVNTVKKEAKKALELIKKLFSLRIVRYLFFLCVTIVVLPLLIFVFIKPTPQQNINYGTTFSNKYAAEMGLNWQETYLAILDDLGTKNIRLVAYWDDIEKTKDQYDYTDIMWQLDEAEKRDLNVTLVVGRKVPRWPECFEPDWWTDIPNEDVKKFEQYEFVKQTVQTLAKYDVIKMWQVENEPFFPFGECLTIEQDVVEQEVKIVRSLDRRPILVQDSGEGGLWYPTHKLGDKLGISMYRKIWFDFWQVFGGRSIYFQYPLAHWTYKIKADIVRVPPADIIVTELQAEPWGPGINSQLSEEDKNKTMSRTDFLSTISYAQKTGFADLYLWGAEWWYWEKTVNNNPFFWDTAKALFK